MNILNSLRYFFVLNRKHISLKESPRKWLESFKNMENITDVCQYLTNIIPVEYNDTVHTYYLIIHQVEEWHYQGD